MRLTLKLVTGEEMKFDVDSNSIVIGRSKKCDVVIPHEGVSRQHCQIELQDGEIFITDLGSTNGVLIDGVRIETGVKTPFLPYLSLAFGAVQSAQIDLSGPHTSPFVTNPLGVTKSKHPERNESQTIKLELESKNSSRKKKNNVDKKDNGKAEQKGKSALGAGPLSPLNFLAAIILAAAILWYFGQEKTPSSNALESSAPETKPPRQHQDHF
jgi:pSer/pThr/pTyr-binding forkhead associated (FHA) protein